jgi:HSP20 family protein
MGATLEADAMRQCVRTSADGGRNRSGRSFTISTSGGSREGGFHHTEENQMSRLDVQKVPAADDRSLPIFAEFDRLADRIRLQAYNLFARRGTGEEHALDDWLAAEREVCWPATELAERDADFVLNVALAGFEPGEITVTATPREVLVMAARKHEQQSPGEGEPKVRWTEFRSDNVFRRVELPSAVVVEKISANFQNGLLKIVAPKAQPAAKTAKKIEVSTGS